MNSFRFNVFVLTVLLSYAILPNAFGDYNRKAMIRNNRIWEYIDFSPSCAGEDFSYNISKMCFKEKEEHNGKIYDVLYEIETQKGYYFNEVHFHDIAYSNRKIALMREENGKVYVKNPMSECDNSQVMEILERLEDDPWSIDIYNDEFLIYDFNPADQFENRIYYECDDYHSLFNNIFILYSFSGQPYKTDTILIDSEPSTRLYYSVDLFELPNEFYNSDHITNRKSRDISVIEGIGPVESGLIYGPYFFTCKIGCVDNGWQLNRVYDKENKVIFKGLDFTHKISAVQEINGYNMVIKYENNKIIVFGENCKLSVYDTTGYCMLNQTVHGGDEVDVSMLPSGTYIATLSTDATLKFRK